MDRKKKLRLIQVIFFLSGFFLIIITFLSKNNYGEKKIISSNEQEQIEKKLNEKNPDTNIFYNVKYSGLDLKGNRYTLVAEEAKSSDLKPEIIQMRLLSAIFYFKDDTVLEVSSQKGEYNNKTLDIKFEENINASYQNGKLSAEKAEFSNSQSFLQVSEKVKIVDKKGTVFADNLVFDLNTKKLNITSEKENLIKSSIKLK